jgi:hypothetical protein
MEVWPRLSKQEVGQRLAAAAADYLATDGAPAAQTGAA